MCISCFILILLPLDFSNRWQYDFFSYYQKNALTCKMYNSSTSCVISSKLESNVYSNCSWLMARGRPDYRYQPTPRSDRHYHYPPPVDHISKCVKYALFSFNFLCWVRFVMISNLSNALHMLKCRRLVVTNTKCE